MGEVCESSAENLRIAPIVTGCGNPFLIVPAPARRSKALT